jgi:hypothetical protein
MHPEATQKRTRMMSRSVPISGIGITASPGEERSAVNDEIASAHESRLERLQHGEHEKGFVEGGSGDVTAFTLLGFAWNADTSVFIAWKTAGQS